MDTSANHWTSSIKEDGFNAPTRADSNRTTRRASHGGRQHLPIIHGCAGVAIYYL